MDICNYRVALLLIREKIMFSYEQMSSLRIKVVTLLLEYLLLWKGIKIAKNITVAQTSILSKKKILFVKSFYFSNLSCTLYLKNMESLAQRQINELKYLL